jgi:hypothetical protein
METASVVTIYNSVSPHVRTDCAVMFWRLLIALLLENCLQSIGVPITSNFSLAFVDSVRSTCRTAG